MNRRLLERRIEKLERAGNRRAVTVRRLPEWVQPRESESGPGPSPGWRYQALPAQRLFHADLSSRFKGYSGPIGCGKSQALSYEALFLSQMNTGLLGLVGAPTYRMLEDSTQRTFFDVLEKEGIDYTFHKQDNRVRLTATGSEVIFRSMENPERLRGPNLAWFALDELTYTREDAWTRMLGRLRHPEATRLCGCAVWTPKGFDWVYNRFVESRPADHLLVQATPKENIHLPADFYEQLKRSYGERFYRQEVLGEYLDVYAGNAYYAFSGDNVRKVDFDSRLPLCWALDFNVDPMCSVICQMEEWKLHPWSMAWYERKKTLRVLDEIVLSNSNTVEATEEFLDRAFKLFGGLEEPPARIPVTIYGDASGNQRTSKSTRTDYQLIKEVFRRYPEFEVSMRENRNNPAIRDRVNTVNRLLRNAAGDQSMIIDPKCKELIKDFRQVKFKRDAAGNPTGNLDGADPERTHVSDALGYLIVQEFGMRPFAGERTGYVAG